MPRPPLLRAEEIQDRLVALASWSLVEGRLHRELEFADFAAAFAFMTRVAAEAERLDHHPDWSNGYARVTIDLSTHDVGGLTELDFALAGAIERAARA